MIVEWLMNVGGDFFAWFADLLPSFDDANGVLVTVGTFLIPLAAGLASLGAWIPWALITACLAITVTWYFGVAAVKLIIRAWSYVPFFGGHG